MHESLKYYPEAVLIDGKVATTGAGVLKRTVETKTQRMLRQTQVSGIVKRPNLPMRALRMANAGAHDIYPMVSQNSPKGGKLAVKTRGRR